MRFRLDQNLEYTDLAIWFPIGSCELIQWNQLIDFEGYPTNTNLSKKLISCDTLLRYIVTVNRAPLGLADNSLQKYCIQGLP